MTAGGPKVYQQLKIIPFKCTVCNVCLFWVTFAKPTPAVLVNHWAFLKKKKKLFRKIGLGPSDTEGGQKVLTEMLTNCWFCCFHGACCQQEKYTTMPYPLPDISYLWHSQDPRIQRSSGSVQPHTLRFHYSLWSNHPLSLHNHTHKHTFTNQT